MWIEEVAAGLDKLPFRFTGKELDEETGLYYYGARYLDPKYSRWLSGDPALGEYIPSSGADPSKLAGMGGVYNTINLHVYHYAGNNPVKYIDPDGRETLDGDGNRRELKPTYFRQQEWEKMEGVGADFWKTACATTSLINELSEEYTTQTGKKLTKSQAQEMIVDAIAAEGIAEDNAKILDWVTAANAMWKTLKQPGSWGYSEDDTSLPGFAHNIFCVYSTPQVRSGNYGKNSNGEYISGGGTLLIRFKRDILKHGAAECIMIFRYGLLKYSMQRINLI